MGGLLLSSTHLAGLKAVSVCAGIHCIRNRSAMIGIHMLSHTKCADSDSIHRGLQTAMGPSDSDQRHIHVLGLGSVGMFAAHALAEAPSRLRTTLLLHRPSLLDQYIANGSQISLQTNAGEIVHHSGYDFEVRHRDGWYCVTASQTQEMKNADLRGSVPTIKTIENLVLSVKASQTVAALTPLRERLNRNSNILFLQNGSGMMDAVNKELFPDPYSRPNYIVGVISHGVRTNKQYHITHTGPSATSLGIVPRREITSSTAVLPSEQELYLIKTICSIPRFNARSYSFIDVLQLQLEKLAVNAFTNSVTALHDSDNSVLKSMSSLRWQLMTEISAIVQKLPELNNVPGVKERFSPERLDQTVMAIVEKNAKTTTSMVWDLRAGRTTEVRFINGYWSKRGREVGMDTPINDELVDKVEALTFGKQKQNQTSPHR